ncbi:basic salivary proline-rich protein 4-like [Prionailurus viverrinus]|uniref:basic salivary proline-rich protein 4-like n=1 Tax=Prionailurus viverrinus TaxID=61388 RepID=UPI001FF3BF19|nr:basic salivary proline-rich protein 4-like [Prionailurus viverrinus]
MRPTCSGPQGVWPDTHRPPGAEGGLVPSGASERATGTALGSSGPLPTDPLQGGGQAQSSPAPGKTRTPWLEHLKDGDPRAGEPQTRARGLPSAVLGSWGPTPCPSRLSPPPGSCQDCSAQSRPPVASPSHRPGRSDSIQVPGVAGHWPGAGSGARAASPHAVQAKRAGLGSGEWVPSCCSPGSVCAVPWPGPAHPCPRPASTRGALLRSRGWRQGLPVRDRAATCRPQPQPHNGALVRGRPAGGGQRLPAHPGLRAPLCGVVAWAGSTEPDGQAPPELSRGTAGPVPPAPCGSWPGTPLRRRWTKASGAQDKRSLNSEGLSSVHRPSGKHPPCPVMLPMSEHRGGH